MLTQKTNQFALPTAVFAIVITIFGFIMVQVIMSQMSSANLSQSATMMESATSVTVENDRVDAEFLTHNQQASGLANNWNIFQASLNYADYPSAVTAIRETARFLTVNQQESGLANNWNIFQSSLNYADYPSVAAVNHETAQFLTHNQQERGLANNWNIYQASLNYADYQSQSSTTLLPYDEDGNGIGIY